MWVYEDSISERVSSQMENEKNLKGCFWIIFHIRKKTDLLLSNFIYIETSNSKWVFCTGTKLFLDPLAWEFFHLFKKYNAGYEAVPQRYKETQNTLMVKSLELKPFFFSFISSLGRSEKRERELFFFSGIQYIKSSLSSHLHRSGPEGKPFKPTQPFSPFPKGEMV